MLLALPGHADAARLREPSVEAFADAIEPMLPDQFALIAHSLGGMVALELASRHAQRVNALVLIETVATVQASFAQRVQASVALQVMRLLGPGVLAHVSGLGQPAATASHLHEQLSGISHAAMMDALRAAYAYDARAKLKLISAPTLILSGRRSRQITASSRQMANAIPGAVFQVLPGGHMLHVDAPELVRNTIGEFLIHVR